MTIKYNLADKTCFCEAHMKKNDCLDNHDIDRIIKSFRIKLDNMEQYLIYIQERLNYYENLNSDVNLKNEGEINNIKESIDRKIRSVIYNLILIL